MNNIKEAVCITHTDRWTQLAPRSRMWDTLPGCSSTRTKTPIHNSAPMALCSYRTTTEPCLNRGWRRWVRRSWRHTPSRAKISCRPCSCGRDRADILRGHSFRMTDTSPLRISLGLPKGSGLITGNSVLGIGLSRVWCRRRMVVYRT